MIAMIRGAALACILAVFAGCDKPQTPAPPALTIERAPVRVEPQPPAVIVAPAPVEPAHRQVPQAATRYRGDLVRQARLVWGMSAPIATFAGQIHQESGWQPSAKSKYAVGLAQFTPATADWISKAYPQELGENQPFNPAWALRALARYDKHLWDRQTRFDSDCDRMGFTLSSYNGGEGWVRKRQRAALAPGQYVTTSRINPGIRPEFQRENEDYPRKILGRWQAIYLSWGLGVDCIGRLT